MSDNEPTKGKNFTVFGTGGRDEVRNRILAFAKRQSSAPKQQPPKKDEDDATS